MTIVHADHRLDTLGLRCPVPILKARKMLGGLSRGAVLEVLADDPAAPQDFAALCRATGHTLLAADQDDGIHRILIRVAD